MLQFQQQEVLILYAVDYGSGYREAERLKRKHAKETWRFLLKGWVKFLGAPSVVVADSSTEFTGKEFKVG